MFAGLRSVTGLLVSRFRFWKTSDKIISFTRSVSDARDVLIVMPLDRRQVLNTVFMIDLLRKKFREENVTFLTRETDQELMRMMPRSQFISLLASETTLFYLPRKEVVRRVQRKSYDLAIDLNVDFLLPSAYICKASGARVRIGLARKRADTFFNFQVRPDPKHAPQGVYDRLATCLQMF
jgi:ADP-heptose:LPS heptosyltransferase